MKHFLICLFCLLPQLALADGGNVYFKTQNLDDTGFVNINIGQAFGSRCNKYGKFLNDLSAYRLESSHISKASDGEGRAVLFLRSVSVQSDGNGNSAVRTCFIPAEMAMRAGYSLYELKTLLEAKKISLECTVARQCDSVKGEQLSNSDALAIDVELVN